MHVVAFTMLTMVAVVHAALSFAKISVAFKQDGIYVSYDQQEKARELNKFYLGARIPIQCKYHQKDNDILCHRGEHAWQSGQD